MQKGTIGILLDGVDMPFNKYGVRPDIILNPNAIPSRMTIGHIVECFVGKVAVLDGMDADGTPFEEHDIESIKDRLEAHGYERNGKEYLYNGMTGEKMKVEIFIGPTFYQRLKHLVEDKIHCLSVDHDVLTSSGWIPIKDVTKDHYVACLENGVLTYEKPTALHHYPNYEGKMYHIETQQIDLLVTLNHRMWISKMCNEQNKWMDFDFELAENIIGKYRKYKKDAQLNQLDYQLILEQTKTENKKIVNMDAWLKFFGLWVTQRHRHNVLTSNEKTLFATSLQIHNQEIKKIIDDILIKLEYIGNYKHNYSYIIINNEQLWLTLENLYGDSDCVLPNWVWSLSQNQCKLLLEYIIIGNKDNEFNCFPEKLSNDVMRLALHCGWYANKSKNKNNFDLYKMEIIKNDSMLEVNSTKFIENNQKEEIINCPEGGVYCLSVPSGVFYVRRNGLPVWTGNSRARGPKTSLTRQAPEGRSRDGGLRLGEMERDALIAHGAAKFLKEKLLDNSDAYTTYVCGICGLFAQRFNRREDKHYSQDTDIYCCIGCNNYTDIHKVKIPYAFKLLIQELQSMCIASRLRFHKDIYNS